MRIEAEKIKIVIKNAIPWRIRYLVKYQEAKGIIKISDGMKQQSDIETYTDSFYRMLKRLKTDNLSGKSICEMGPGQFLSNAFLEYQLGADREYLLEIADFAKVESRVVMNKSFYLRSGYKKKRQLPEPEADEAWSSYLKKVNALYLTTGLEGYKSVPDNSVDYVYSVAVLEHIRKNMFADTIKQMYRFMKAGGCCCHVIDFTDHLGGRKNHLRFPEKKWEDEIHYRMDNYTNRLSCSEMVRILHQTGFTNITIEKNFFKRMPVKRSKITRELQKISMEDLMMCGAVIYAEKTG